MISLILISLVTQLPQAFAYHATKTVKLDSEGIRFPLKARYDQINFSLEGWTFAWKGDPDFAVPASEKVLLNPEPLEGIWNPRYRFGCEELRRCLASHPPFPFTFCVGSGGVSSKPQRLKYYVDTLGHRYPVDEYGHRVIKSRRPNEVLPQQGANATLKQKQELLDTFAPMPTHPAALDGMCCSS
jgi:hypothetical protein